jgi:hypothetical protein
VSGDVLRVFPRRTSYTPRDGMVFVGDPPLFRPEAEEVHVSIAFTWDLEEGRRLQQAWANHYPIVKLGGPAVNGRSGEFEPGRYVKEGVTFTSRGCPHSCLWCLVPEREGKLTLLEVKAGWIVQDNNLLATPPDHQLRVFQMLRKQKRRVSFPGGLDARLLDNWVAAQLSTLKIDQVFLAADTDGALKPLRAAVEKLSFLGRDQLRCYVLIGRGSLESAVNRLEAVWDAGCLPFAQLYQPGGKWVVYPGKWKALARTWSRPAAMKAIHKGTA